MLLFKVDFTTHLRQALTRSFTLSIKGSVKHNFLFEVLEETKLTVSPSAT